MVWFGAIAELASVVATTFMSLIGATRIMASCAAQRTAASDAGDPSTPTTMLDRVAGMKTAFSRQTPRDLTPPSVQRLGRVFGVPSGHPCGSQTPARFATSRSGLATHR